MPCVQAQAAWVEAKKRALTVIASCIAITLCVCGGGLKRGIGACNYATLKTQHVGDMACLALIKSTALQGSLIVCCHFAHPLTSHVHTMLVPWFMSLLVVTCSLAGCLCILSSLLHTCFMPSPLAFATPHGLHVCGQCIHTMWLQ